MSGKLHFTATVIRDGEPAVSLPLKGRTAWALMKLVDAQPKGVTPITHVGPRWSEYIRQLRCDGIHIETVRKGHRGPFPGQHGEYVLRDVVEIEGGNLETWRRENPRA